MSRFWKATLAVLAAGTVLGVAYDRILRPWHQHWGMTPDELNRSWPGDELVPNACSDATHAITINAPASQIWPWIVQIGQDRAGFYSYTQLENLIGCEMRNADQIVPEWQERRVGDMVWMTPKSKFNGVGRMEIALLEPNRAMILIPARDVPPAARPGGGANGTWGFILEPIDEHSTRLIMRGRGERSPRLRDRVTGYAFWELAHFIMERKMMLSIKERVERAKATAESTATSSVQPVAP
ncbi:MAG TPA: hypothetical protein VII23_21245 [Terriglobales bacterium]